MARVVTSSLIAPQEFVSYRIGPLVVKVLWIDAARGQILVELGLLWIERLSFKLIDGCCRVPERMAFQLMPVDSSNWIFLQQPKYQVIEIVRETLQWCDLLFCDLLQNTLERVLIEWHLAVCHFVHYDTQRPEVRVEREDAFIFEKFRRHVVDTARLLDSLLLLSALCDQV